MFYNKNSVYLSLMHGGPDSESKWFSSHHVDSDTVDSAEFLDPPYESRFALLTLSTTQRY